MDGIAWDQWIAQYDGGDTAALTEQICRAHGLRPAEDGKTIATVLQVLYQQKKKQQPRPDRYVCPAMQPRSDDQAKQEHVARAKTVAPVIQAIVQQRLLDADTNPAVLLFDMDAFNARLANLKAAFPERVFNHALAVKSNPTRGILRAAQKQGFGAECASFAEASHALSLGFPPRRIVYDSPCKTRPEIRHMLEAGVYINLDNEHELEKLATIFEEMGGATAKHDAQIGLRVNPVVGGGSIDALSTAMASSKFGLPWTPETEDRLLALFQKHPWLQGVHVHVGSQGCPLDLLVAGVKRVVEFALKINRCVGRQQIRVLDMGGGMPTVYDGGADELFDYQAYAEALHAQVPKLFSSGFQSIVTEFGRSMFVKPGLTVSRVEAVKQWAGQNIAVIHTGGDLFQRCVYLPETWSHSITMLDSHGQVKDNRVQYARQDIAGPLCFSGDLMAKQILVPQASVGDVVVIHDTGGYTLSMFSKYNSRQVPAYYAYTRANGGFQFALLKQRETPEETLAFWGLDQDISFGKAN